MQRRNHFLQGGQSPLLNLPEDLLIFILKLEKQKLSDIAQVSQRFHHIVNKVFRNTLYARALQFETWQKEKVTAFKRSIKDFIRDNEVSVLNRPDLNREQRNQYNFSLLIPFFITVIGVLAIIKFYLISRSVIPTLVLTGVFVFVSVSLYYFHFNNIEQRNAYHNSTIRQDHLDQLQVIMNTYKEIIADLPLAQNMQLEVTIIIDLINTLQVDTNYIEQASNKVAEFLIETSRFSPHKKFDAKQFDKLNDHGIKDYGLNLCLLWNERNRENEILEIKDVDSIPRSPHVLSYGTFQR